MVNIHKIVRINLYIIVNNNKFGEYIFSSCSTVYCDPAVTPPAKITV